MENQIEVFAFQSQNIAFDILDTTILINATQMAKIYCKKTENFLRTEQTKNFINSSLNYAKKRNSNLETTTKSPFANIKKREDLVVSKQNTGTWMHRILALKFAAWLDPDFELWVYDQIDQILFSDYRELQTTINESAVFQNEIEKLEKELENSDTYKKLQEAKKKKLLVDKKRSKQIRNQFDMFKNQY